MHKRRTIILSGLAAICAVTAARASVEISSAPTRNMQCSAGVCAPTTKKAVLNATHLANMLAASDVKVITGNGAVTITVMASFSWTSASRLTLDAAQSVGFRAPVSVAGRGGLSIVYNDGGTGGDLVFFSGAKVDFWDLRSSLTINGASYNLVGNLKALKRVLKRDGSGIFALANDYDASRDTSWPIKNLEGVFEGLGHTISNLTSSDETKHHKKRPHNSVALFLQVFNGTVRDLALTNVVFTRRNTRRGFFGALASQYYSGTVDNVSASVNMTFEGRNCVVGGLIGLNETAVIKKSVTTGKIEGCAYTGGLVGANTGQVLNSTSSVAVSGNKHGSAGGLIGDNSGLVSQSMASGTVNGNFAGGLAGANYVNATIDQSYATGAVSGELYAGGLVGENANLISNSYATGSVNAPNAGGLVGLDGDECGCQTAISTSYARGAVSGSVAGGVIGSDRTAQHDNGDVYWDLDTSGIGNPAQGAGDIANDAGLIGLSDAQLRAGLPAGFDPAIWAWTPDANGGYPYLLADPPQ